MNAFRFDYVETPLTRALATFKLTRRETQIAVLMIAGYSNPQICDFFQLKQKAAKFHVTNIYKKNEVKSRAELQAKFSQFGFDYKNLPPYRPKPLKPGKPKGPAAAVAADQKHLLPPGSNGPKT